MNNRTSKDNIWHIVSQTFSFDIKLLHAGIVQDFQHKPQNQPLDRFVLSYLIEGEGIYELKGKTYKIEKGDLYFIPPGMPYREQNSPSNPYVYYCIAFYGNNCSSLLAHAGLTEDTPVLNVNDIKIEEKMREIFEFCQKNTFLSLTKANVSFIEMLSVLYEKKENNYQKIKDNHQRYVELAQKYIHENYHRDITITTICLFLHISRSYFSEIFKKVVGISIKEYIIFYRINEAMRMLIHTDIPVTKIAEMVGFNDYPNFYRCFKSKIGVSPKTYRGGYHPVPTKATAIAMAQAKRNSFSFNTKKKD